MEMEIIYMGSTRVIRGNCVGFWVRPRFHAAVDGSLNQGILSKRCKRNAGQADGEHRECSRSSRRTTLHASNGGMRRREGKGTCR
jgi:hypothetical protein